MKRGQYPLVSKHPSFHLEFYTEALLHSRLETRHIGKRQDDSFHASLIVVPGDHVFHSMLSKKLASASPGKVLTIYHHLQEFSLKVYI